MLRLWKLCCSLKLAVIVASIATFLLMGGSLLFPSNPMIFGPLDNMPFGAWLNEIAAQAPALSWWIYPFAGALALLILNTSCCFIDWLINIRSRWRKAGEYLIHLGTILLFVGFCVGAMGGWRHIALPCTVGALTPLSSWPGHYLRVDSFKPELAENGRPLDMISQVRVFRGEEQLFGGEVRINQPILKDGLVITPASFGRQPAGFSFLINGKRSALRNGDSLKLENGSQLEVKRFLADARYGQQGQIEYRNDRIGNPAFDLLFTSPGGQSWRGWYFLSQQPPGALRSLGLTPLGPLYSSYSSLTINYDPGAGLTAGGAILLSAGCFLALFSFYRKRRHLDRPEV